MNIKPNQTTEAATEIDITRLVMGDSYRIKTGIPNKYGGWVFAEFGRDPDFAKPVFWSAVEIWELHEILDIEYTPVNPVPADDKREKIIVVASFYENLWSGGFNAVPDMEAAKALKTQIEKSGRFSWIARELTERHVVKEGDE